MSDFLVNLARRGAGLAPVVRARSGPPPVASETPSEPAADPVVARDFAPAPVVMAIANAPPAATTIVAPTTVRAIAPPIIAPVSAPVVQRAAAVLPAAPAAIPATVAYLETAPVAPRPSIVGEAAVREHVVVHAAAPGMPASAVVPRSIDTLPSATAPEVMPAIALPAHDTPSPVAVTIRPAEFAAPANARTQMEPAAERTINVRIGAIEIYGAETGPVLTPAAIAPAPVAATVSPAASGGGFDDYAALRSYAPWTW